MKAYKRMTARTNKKMNFRRKAFTLIELLVVMAITSILLVLVFKPIIDGFNLTSRAGTQIESQATARDLNREVGDLLGNASFVFDNVQTPINLWLTDKGNGGYSPQGGDAYAIPSTSAMVEYVLPARQSDQTPGAGAIDPTTGLPIYENGADPRSTGFALPLIQGRALGRIFIGLRDNRPATTQINGQNPPLHPYGNRFEDPAQVSGANDNRYVLYRAEVLAYTEDPDKKGAYIPNIRLFHTTDAQGNIGFSKTGSVVLHDPNFFYDNSLAGGDGDKKWAAPGWRDLDNDGKVEIWENWKAISNPMVTVNKADMIALDRDDDNLIRYDKTTGLPTVRPLARFEPSSVQNDPGVAATLDYASNESPTGATSVYTTQYSHWATPYRVLVYRSANPGDDPLSHATLDYYMATGGGTPPGKIIHVANAAPNSGVPDAAAFNAAPDVGPGAQPATGTNFIFDPQNYTKADFYPFTVDARRGIVNFSFPASVMIHDANNAPLPSRYTAAYINEKLEDNTIGKRSLYLHNLDTTLTPAPAVSPLMQFEVAPGTYYRVKIVPGSERVYGPDQRPGPHYGYRIQYERVSAAAGTIGKNEYKILYEDVPGPNPSNDPRLRVGFIEFNSDYDGSENQPNYGPSAINPQATMEDPANGVYRPHGLPQYRVVNGVNAASDFVEVYYNFQMNHPGDVVKVDYLTRELMNVTIESRLYDPATSTPQITTVTNRIRVRNLQH